MRSTFNTKRLILFSSLLSLSAWASHGTHSTGASGAASAMGGTGQANYTTETEALFRNPALLSTNVKEAFKPRLEISSAFAKHNSQGAQALGAAPLTLPAYTGSKDGVNVLPNIAAGMKITDELGVALGIVGLGGSAVDYAGTGQLSDQKSEQLMYRMTPAASYKILDNLSVGAGLVVGYSRLALNSNNSTNPSKSATALGGIFGVSYSPVQNLRLGASYVTKTKFGFDSLYDLEALTGTPDNTLNHVDFQEPAEFGIGVSYEVGNLTVAADYRRIGWSSALGYSDLGWADQGIIALGGQYKMDKLSLRLGFNYGKSPFGDVTGTSGDVTQNFQGVSAIKSLVDIANYSGFTAMTELEFDGGVGYQFTDALSADLALVYTPTKTVTADGNSVNTGGAYIVSSKANEWAIVAGVNYQL